MINIYNAEEIKIISEGGKLLADILRKILELVKPGVTTQQLDEYAEQLILKTGGVPSFKGYKIKKHSTPYPTTICASINDHVVHCPALPAKTLKPGDIISIDIGMKYKEYFTDHAVTVGVGNISNQASKLIRVTQEAMLVGIQEAKPGNSIKNISTVIQHYVEKNNFSVVKALVGHGVGKNVHEEPMIPNFIGKYSQDIKLQTGMVLAIEPMVNVGSWEVQLLNDGFTYATSDHSLAAHFEHTIVITDNGPVILTI